MDQTKIGKFIASKRKEHGLTQSQLAEKLGITDKAVSKWETGKSLPDLSLFTPLCSLLDITLNELLLGEVIPDDCLKEKSDQVLFDVISGLLGNDRGYIPNPVNCEKVLELENVKKIYEETGAKTAAINGISLEVTRGSFVGIMGASGSGKSTLAKHMNAILIPTGGTVWVDGQDTKDPENLWDVRKSAGMVFQNPDNQIIGTVVEEDVGFGPENIGIPTDEIWERVGESLRLVGMTEYRASSPNKLSGGQKQRVAIAGVIAMEPKCIVLDEPTAMLDPNGRKEVLQAVARLRKEKNVTVILITHYMEEVIDADQVFVMDSGHIVMHGTPREIFGRADELKSYRMDVPQVTMLAEELRKRGLDIPKGILRREELVEALCRLR